MITQLIRIGRSCDEIREGHFKFGVGKHLIFYRHKEKDHIEIVRTLHARMDTESHFIYKSVQRQFCVIAIPQPRLLEIGQD
ncbi:type II toxin-antitoxin system RelE/ParE family toxin [Nitrosomonas sp.]|uniref:type II toxin-antitoxin system RelE/ParE family toxin n=1 Tax=Nitrosomonas sp. TaxID=42353 RepID=UPI0032EFA342